MEISNGVLLRVASVGLMVSSLIFTIVGLTKLPKILREGRMPNFRGCADPVIRRSDGPAGFWFVLSLYGLGMLAMLAFAVWFVLEVFVYKKFG
jgi:hypothetical protein